MHQMRFDYICLAIVLLLNLLIRFMSSSRLPTSWTDHGFKYWSSLSYFIIPVAFEIYRFFKKFEYLRSSLLGLDELELAVVVDEEEFAGGSS
jgi:hypothetical protein